MTSAAHSVLAASTHPQPVEQHHVLRPHVAISCTHQAMNLEASKVHAQLWAHRSTFYAVKLRVLAEWKLTSVAGSASVPDDSAAESSDMADKVEMVRPTEFGCRSPVLYTLSPSSLSEPGALSEESTGVLISADEDETCSITIIHVLRTYGHISALPTVIHRFHLAIAQHRLCLNSCDSQHQMPGK